MKHTHQRTGCCGQMDGCPTLGQIAANSPFVLENLEQLKRANV